MRVYAFLCMVAIVNCIQITKQLNYICKTILNMITLQQFTEIDFNPLFTALDDIIESTQQAKQDEADQLENYYQQFLSNSEFYSTQVTEYNTEVAQHQSDITTFKKDRNSLQQSLNDKIQQLNDAQELKLNYNELLSNNQKVRRI